MLLFLSACSAPAPTPLAGGGTPTPPPAHTPTLLLLFYSSAPGRYAVQIPATLSIQEMTSTQTIANQVVTCTAIGSKDYSAVWIVRYCDYPPEAIGQISTQTLLDSARDLAFGNHAHKLIDEQDVSLNGIYPGRSVVADIEMRNNNGPFNGVLLAHIFVAENRVYTVAAEVYTETATTRLSLVDPFLESFMINSN